MIEEDVKDLCKRDKAYARMLAIALELDEERGEWRFDPWSWRVAPGRIKALINRGIVKRGYTSNQYKFFRLRDRKAVERGLKEVFKDFNN